MRLAPTFVPSELVPVIRLNPETHQREMVILRWSLASDSSRGTRLTHARAETVATRRAFREAFRQRRCLIVTDGVEVRKRRLEMKNGQPFGMGGLWERWEESEQFETCTVITTSANELVQPIGDRMPVIIAEEDYDSWLDPKLYDEEELQRIMQPLPAHRMVIVPL